MKYIKINVQISNKESSEVLNQQLLKKKKLCNTHNRSLLLMKNSREHSLWQRESYFSLPLVTIFSTLHSWKPGM